MPVQDPPFNGALNTTTSYQPVYENQSFGVHEGYITFENIGSSDKFMVRVDVKNPYRANLTTLREFEITYAYLANGTVPTVRIAARQTNHMKVQVKRTAGSDRTISYSFYLITAK